jgi:hypothetical protein
MLLNSKVASEQHKLGYDHGQGQQLAKKRQKEKQSPQSKAGAAKEEVVREF